MDIVRAGRTHRHRVPRLLDAHAGVVHRHEDTGCVARTVLHRRERDREGERRGHRREGLVAVEPPLAGPHRGQRCLRATAAARRPHLRFRRDRVDEGPIVRGGAEDALASRLRPAPRRDLRADHHVVHAHRECGRAVAARDRQLREDEVVQAVPAAAELPRHRRTEVARGAHRLEVLERERGVAIVRGCGGCDLLGDRLRGRQERALCVGLRPHAARVRAPRGRVGR